jgi:flagella basal body P-ring formation protein FlgA
LVLREQIKVFSNIVTLGDLFDNAGAESSAPVFRSPDLGTSGVVAAKRVAAASRQHGLEWPNPGGILEVKVSRPGRMILLDDVRDLIADRAAGDDDDAAYRVTFSRGAKPFYIDPKAEGEISVKQMELNTRSGRFRAVIGAPEGNQNVQDKVYTGRAYPTVEAIVPTRLIKRGATIVAEDLKMVRLPRTRVSQSAIEEVASAVGMAAKQRLIIGRPVRSTDLEEPKLVKRNMIVTIAYSSPGLTLKAKGRALADGGRGEMVAILNLQSKRTLEGKVTGSGIVSVSTRLTQQALTAPPAQTANIVQQTRTALRARANRGGRNSYVIR